MKPKMKIGARFRRVFAISLLGLVLHAPSFAQTLGVSVPAATHGWTGGLNFHAEKTKSRLESQYPELKIILVTASNASEQANDLEDLRTIHQIDALVILPLPPDNGVLCPPKNCATFRSRCFQALSPIKTL